MYYIYKVMYRKKEEGRGFAQKQIGRDKSGGEGLYYGNRPGMLGRTPERPPLRTVRAPLNAYGSPPQYMCYEHLLAGRVKARSSRRGSLDAIFHLGHLLTSWAGYAPSSFFRMYWLIHFPATLGQTGVLLALRHHRLLTAGGSSPTLPLAGFRQYRIYFRESLSNCTRSP